ncbi:S8 family peptidase [Mucilaginibacter sp. ZT4R22]|uniref:S8 family peptidase n=1 Tax=Mucilaginibacter pankratovii TaxID=2772110 RepID=A0ABR7WSU1_9SPHI|nr:S8 family peptidase [Mucilaginibacter pankratovii]MBD1365379.1 S8 family peptidase [Mucilaginibacter pankratovii]
MPDFPHLNLKRKLRGAYHFTGVPIKKKIDPTTQANLEDRPAHGAKLRTAADTLLSDYTAFLEERKEQGLPDALPEEVLPIFLKVDPNDFDIEALKGFGIEIVAEEENGYIIGANADRFSSLAKKIQEFIDIKGRSKDQAAKLWEIVIGNQWRPDYILSPKLRERYPANIADDEVLTLDISVACYLKMPDLPMRVLFESEEDYEGAKARWGEHNKNNPEKGTYRKRRVPDTDKQYQRKIDRWRETTTDLDIQRDEIAMERQDHLADFIVNKYGGEILSTFVEMEDSFGFRAKMSGQAFKDLVRGYAYIFEIVESDEIFVEDPTTEMADNDGVEILPPEQDAPVFCVIDSGIQEQHILLAPAILRQYSKSYVPGDASTADAVPNGGHGTQVAGAILFGNTIPEEGQHQPPCFIINARVLDGQNSLLGSLYPAELMETIVDDLDGIKLFNMSVASQGPCRTLHISSWAAKLDSLIHGRQLLFVLAAGNLLRSSRAQDRPGVREHLEAGRTYPGYLLQPSSRISNPSQSLLSLTVGSVCSADFKDADRTSFGERDRISSFSRCGLGMWGSVKPDVVEYGGDFLREINSPMVTQHDSVSVKVVKSGGTRTGFAVGTSFAAPKVSHIIAHLAKRFPDFNPLFYKALVVQSARLPERVFHDPNINVLRAFGYGIPDLDRALNNSPFRITFFAEGNVAAHQANLYTVKIPKEINRAGTDHDILLEVTMVYTAEPRRTRRRLRSYFGTWLTWESSKLGEPFEVFSNRILKDMEEPDTGEGDEAAADVDSIKWTLSTSPNYGKVSGAKRQDSATQKDWAILKSNTLGDELTFAVVGHKGWDKDTTKEMPFTLAISFEILSKEIEIYKLIEVANQVETEVRAEAAQAVAVQIST